MRFTLPLFPEAASSFARDVDALYLFLWIVSGILSVLITVLIVWFAVKYRRRSEADIPAPMAGGLRLELAWTVIPLILVLVMFAWGARVYMLQARAPAGALEVHVVAKQWMWKLQHLTGQREINELHVPVNRAVRLIMTSEDVIHSFFVPAFRTKWDVLPGRYTSLWFRPTKTGSFHLFCAEYCGTRHSRMIGYVHVLDPVAYQDWLSGGGAPGSASEAGQKLFQDLLCNNCHHIGEGPPGRGPDLEDLFGQPVQLASGATVTADEGYLRESILRPDAKIVAGFEPIMPSFQGLVSEEGLLQLIAYIKSIGPRQHAQPARPAGAREAVSPPARPAPAGPQGAPR